MVNCGTTLVFCRGLYCTCVWTCCPRRLHRFQLRCETNLQPLLRYSHLRTHSCPRPFSLRSPSTPPSTMLLTQKPQHLNFRHHHRRHPASLSNIAVVAHPTSTPGLLSLSKPSRPTSRHPQRPQSPRFPRNRLHRPTSSVSVPSPAVSAPDSARGRSFQQSKAQPQSMHPRPVSQVQLPNTPPSAVPEAVVPVSLKEDALPEHPMLVSQPTGRLARSRRSRHRSTPAVAKSSPSPEPSRGPRAPSPINKFESSAPIPVPERRRAESQAPSHKILSRSDPMSKLTIHTNFSTPLKAPRSDKRNRNKAARHSDGIHLPLAEWDYPAPGSSDDEVEGCEAQPVTPIGQTGRNHKAWQTVFQEGPKTAPLPPSASQQFPFFTFPPRAPPASPPRAKTPSSNIMSTTPPKQVRREHRRAPSQPASFSRGSTAETVFHFSEDETDALPVGADVHEKMALLFGNGNTSGSGSPLFPSTGTPSPSPRKHKAPRDRERSDFWCSTMS